MAPPASRAKARSAVGVDASRSSCRRSERPRARPPSDLLGDGVRSGDRQVLAPEALARVKGSVVEQNIQAGQSEELVRCEAEDAAPANVWYEQA